MWAIWLLVGIFVSLVIATILVLKFCKRKTLKIALSSVIILITFYFAMLSVDMGCVYALRKPVFALQDGTYGSMDKYQGIGYVIALDKNENGQIIQMEMYMFGKVLAAVIA